jgi:hypothetical protein
MKRVMIGAAMLFMLSSTTDAQTKKSTGKNTGSKNSVAKKTTSKKSAKKVKNSSDTATILSTTASYNANAAPASFTTQYFISDPLVKALDARASGAPIRISGSGIVGMPRGSYGFGKGQLKLYNTGATTSGGITGNGSVGTGSYLGSIGTHAAASGVNGKSPYAGSHMWGLNGALAPGYKSDSSLRRIDVKKD